MTDADKQEERVYRSRLALSKAVFNWIDSLGYDPVCFDYSYIETFFDEVESDYATASEVTS